MKIWFEDNTIPCIEWFLYFSDFNSIEYCWKYIKEWIHKHYSEFMEQIEDMKEIKKRMMEVLQDA
jgi:hypothetical protein